MDLIKLKSLKRRLLYIIRESQCNHKVLSKKEEEVLDLKKEIRAEALVCVGR